jgi:hypothetical protein
MRLCNHKPMFGIVMCEAKFMGYSNKCDLDPCVSHVTWRRAKIGSLQ